MAQTPDTFDIRTGDGTSTLFSFDFPYLQQADVYVEVDEVPVGFVFSTGSTVELSEAPALGASVYLYRDTPAATTAYDFQLGAPFLPAFIDENFNQLLYAVQEGIDRTAEVERQSLRVPENTGTTFIPAVAERANKVLAFDANGDPVTVTASTDSAAALAARLASTTVGEGAALVSMEGGPSVQAAVTTNAEAILDRVIRVTSVAVMEALTATSGTQVLVSGSSFKYDGINWQPTGRVWADAFGNDLQAVGNWMKLDPSRIVYLRDGATYELLSNTEYFLARIKCDGLATIVTKEGTTLRYDNAVDGSDIVDIEGIQFIVEGSRDSEDLTASSSVYVNPAIPIKSLRIKRCVMKAIYIPGDYAAWSDTVGKTRASNFIRAICDDSEISEVSHYGFALFYVMTPDTDQAVHKEIGVTGFNCQTNVWLRPEAGRTEFKYGESLRLSIINTEDEQLFWTGKNEGRYINGMDTLLSGPSHSTKHLIRSITGINNIERSCYLQGDNMDAFGLYDKGSTTCAHIKSAIEPKSNNIIRGITSIDTKSPAVNFSTYGQTNAVFQDLTIRQLPGSLQRVLPVGARVLGDLTYIFDGGVITNGAVGFYISNDTRLEKISVSNYNFINVFSSSQRASVFDHNDDAAMDTGEIRLENVRHTVDKNALPSELPNSTYAFKNCEEVYLSNCTGVSERLPFICDNVDYAEINKCNFEIRSGVTEENAFSRLDNLLFVATKFDFVVNILGIISGGDNKIMAVRMVRKQVSGMVKCIDYWTEIEAGITPPSSESFYQVLANLTGYSFRVSAFRDGDSISFDYDGVAETTSNVVISGSFFSNAISADLRVFIDSGSLVLRTTSTSLTVGDINVKLVRL